MTDEANRQLAKAEHLIEIDRPSEAIPLLTGVLATDPDNYFANCHLSLCYFQLAQPETSLEFSKKALASFHQGEWGHRLRSAALLSLDRKKEALDAALEAHRLEPDSPDVMNSLIECYLANGRINDAEGLALKMREIAPEGELAHLALGSVYLAKGDNWSAAECFRKALNINPVSFHARNNLGVALLHGTERGYEPLFDATVPSIRESSRDGSLEQFTEALKLDPANSLVAQNLRLSLDYSLPFYTFIVLIPFTLLALFAAPGLSVLFLVMMIAGVIQQLWQTRRKRRGLPDEVKRYLSAARPKGVRRRTNDLIAFGKTIFAKTWQVHLLLIATIFLAHAPLNSNGSFTATRSWNQTLAWLMTIASFFWLGAKLR